MSDILAHAKFGSFEIFGLKKLEVRDDLQFGEKIPMEAFAVRGPNSERIYQWSDSLMGNWNQGDFEIESFISENCGSVTPRPVRFCPDLLTRKHGFLRPPSNRDVFRISVKCGYNDYRLFSGISGVVYLWTYRIMGGESIAKVVSVSKFWLSTTNARGGRLLFTRQLLNF